MSFNKNPSLLRDFLISIIDFWEEMSIIICKVMYFAVE